VLLLNKTIRLFLLEKNLIPITLLSILLNFLLQKHVPLTKAKGTCYKYYRSDSGKSAPIDSSFKDSKLDLRISSFSIAML
jgi:hypothetical protein